MGTGGHGKVRLKAIAKKHACDAQSAINVARAAFRGASFGETELNVVNVITLAFASELRSSQTCKSTYIKL